MNDHPIDPARPDGPHPGSPTGVDDGFAAELRARLQSATARLEPTLTFDEMIGEVVDGRVAATSPRRTWARAGAIGLAAASLVAVLVWTVRSPDRPSVSSPSSPPTIPAGPEASTSPSSVDLEPTAAPTTDDTTASDAVNILVVGADNNACIDPDSPFAGGFGDRESMGERSDTIMMVRLDPVTEQVAVLSFPRDLWVSMSGRPGKGRINSAYVRDDPIRLIDTIQTNFGIWTDHFVQIDFCAFKTIVDGLGGVNVPFEYPTRDITTGLNVPEAGCFTFDGDHALAYVRSRKLQFMDDSGTWQYDPFGDLGRISRQQDFLRRVLQTALDRGITDVAVARSVITAIQDNVVVDQDLTISTMLDYVGVLADVSPDELSAFTIEVESANVGGNSVLLPRIDGENMRAVLALFRGEKMFAPSTSPGPVVPEENPMGVIPPREITC